MRRNHERRRHRLEHLDSETIQDILKRLIDIEERDLFSDMPVAMLRADCREKMFLVLKVDVQRCLRDLRRTRHVAHARGIEP